MEKITFPPLTKDDIDVRIAHVKEGAGYSLLLYKNARVDMRILDDTVGPMEWQREPFSVDGKMHCRVSIWDAQKSQWISKSDVGTESSTEATKGESSDAFKRACFNWGIGRELYTAPFIWVKDEAAKKETLKLAKFAVLKIDITETHTISGVEIVSLEYGEPKDVVFSTYRKPAASRATEKPTAPPVCPRCKKAVQAAMGKDGVERAPIEVLELCKGVCGDCYKKIKEATNA